jgi:hypothetical protein
VIIPARDPRIDPQRGDVVRGNGQVRRVMAREGDRVRCESGVYEYRMRRDNRRKWCRLNGAEVAQIPHGRWSSRARGRSVSYSTRLRSGRR